MISSLIPKLVHRLDTSLPGETAFKKLSPIQVDNYITPKTDHKLAGVMSLIYPKEGQAHLLFMKRTSHHPQDKHAGQISFPGGKKDQTDANLLACARRECWEEVGIHKEQYQVLGNLTELYVSASNFLVHPFLAYSDEPLDFRIETEEVAEIIEFPLVKLLNYKNLDKTDVFVRGYKLQNVPYFDLDGQVLWGATSMITSEIIHVLSELNVAPDDLIY